MFIREEAVGIAPEENKSIKNGLRQIEQVQRSTPDKLYVEDFKK